MDTQTQETVNQSLPRHRFEAVEDRIYAQPIAGGNGKFLINGLVVDPQPIADGIYRMICETGKV